MHILYTWIKEYKNIIGQGFNFSSQFLFSYNKENGKFEVSLNEKYIPDLYGTNISDLTAIIGENGAEKTNIIDFICREIINGKAAPQGIFVIGYTIFYSGKLKFEFESNIIQDGQEMYRFFPQEFHTHPMWESNISKTPTIYYSNFVRKELNAAFSNNGEYHFDISTSHLLWGEKRNYFRGYSHLRLSYTGIYFNEETQRQIEYVCNYKANDINFIPKNAKINFNNYDLTEIESSMQEFNAYKEQLLLEIDLIKENELRANVMNKINSLKLKFNNLEEFIDRLYIHTFINRLRHEAGLRYDIGSKSKNSRFQMAQKALVFKKGKEIFEEYFSDRPDNFDFYNTKLDYLISIVKNGYELQLIKFEKNQLIVELNEEGRSILKRIFEAYNEIITEYGFFNFEWHGLSAGENAFLSLCSRMTWISKKIANNIIKSEEIIIILDEGEDHYHPQWQKSFFVNLKKLIDSLFKNNKVQLILTSHSPFVVSDFTLSNIIFLKKSYNGDCLVLKNPLNERKETFASNIHTLFTDSFFLSGGLIGDFAKEKINELIDTLNSPRALSKDQKVYFKKIIGEIGEPLIKRKLFQLYDDKLKLNIDDEITDLQNRINKLENRQNDTDKKN